MRQAFEEDRAVLNAVRIGMSEKTSPHIDLPIDAGQFRFRRQLAATIAEEAAVDETMSRALFLRAARPRGAGY